MTDPARSWPLADESEPTPLFEKIIKKEKTVPLLTPDEDANVPQTSVWDGRHPGVAHFKVMFQTDHLADNEDRDRLATVIRRCAELAETMVETLDDGPELTAGLRSLWEAKNSFVVQAARFTEKAVG